VQEFECSYARVLGDWNGNINVFLLVDFVVDRPLPDYNRSGA
jgi:hypothetical protein